MSPDSFFQRVNDSGWTNLQYPCRITDTAAIETHVHDLLFDRRGTAFVEEISLKAIMRTVGVLALIALYAGFGLATCVFRPNVAPDSGSNLPSIPVEACP